MTTRRRIMTVVAVSLAARAGYGSDLYVAPDGKDAWSGRTARVDPDGPDGPFATLGRARDEIRRIRQANGLPAGGITVHLRGGVYPLTETFALTEQDSGTKDRPITYRAYRDESVRLMGGRRVTGWQRVTDEKVRGRLDPAARDHVVWTDVKGQGITDFGHPVAAGVRFELFFAGKPMQLARWPDSGFVEIVDVVGGQPITVHGRKGDKIGKFTYADDRPRGWADEDEIWLHGYWFWNWSDAFQKVESIDVERRVIATVPPYHNYGYRKGGRYYALNLLAELDVPGEFYGSSD